MITYMTKLNINYTEIQALSSHWHVCIWSAMLGGDGASETLCRCWRWDGVGCHATWRRRTWSWYASSRGTAVGCRYDQGRSVSIMIATKLIRFEIAQCTIKFYQVTFSTPLSLFCLVLSTCALSYLFEGSFRRRPQQSQNSRRVLHHFKSKLWRISAWWVWHLFQPSLGRQAVS